MRPHQQSGYANSEYRLYPTVIQTGSAHVLCAHQTRPIPANQTLAPDAHASTAAAGSNNPAAHSCPGALHPRAEWPDCPSYANGLSSVQPVATPDPSADKTPLRPPPGSG